MRRNTETDLIYQICQQTLHFIAVHRLFTAETDCGAELCDGDPRPPHWGRVCLFRLLEAAREEDLPEQVPQGDISAAL